MKFNKIIFFALLSVFSLNLTAGKPDYSLLFKHRLYSTSIAYWKSLRSFPFYSQNAELYVCLHHLAGNGQFILDNTARQLIDGQTNKEVLLEIVALLTEWENLEKTPQNITAFLAKAKAAEAKQKPVREYRKLRAYQESIRPSSMEPFTPAEIAFGIGTGNW